MLSKEEISDRDREVEQTKLEALVQRVQTLENRTADADTWLSNVRLSSRMVRSDLPGGRVSQSIQCERNEQVTACDSFMMPSGSSSCVTGITDEGRTCASSGCDLPSGQTGYTLRAICTEVLADR